MLVCVSPGLSLEEEIVRKALAQGMPGARRHRAVRVARRARDGARDHRHERQDHRDRARRPPAAQRRHGLRGGGQYRAARACSAYEKRLLPGKAPRAWVLELSSFQLETTWSLAPRAAAMLNLTEDHLDRYAGLDDYGAAKARIFQGAGVQVLNRDDPRSLAMALPGRKVVTFGLDAPPRRRLRCRGKQAGSGSQRDRGGGRARHPWVAQRRQRARRLRAGFSVGR